MADVRSSFPLAASTPSAVADLQRRIALRRIPIDPWDGDGRRGFGGQRLAGLLERWADGHDWASREADIRALPWRRAAGLNLIYRSAGDGAPVVLLLHGWPDSVLRFARVLPLLRDVTVVVPALPGFPFAAPTQRAYSVGEIADQVAAAMSELGHERFVVSGGDIGGDIAEILADGYADRVAAMHLTGVSARHVFGVDPSELPEGARAYIGAAMGWNRENGGYVAEQSTRPSTLMVGLTDSPAGLAAWLLEKITAWSDQPSVSFSDDELLDWVSAYWYSGCIGTSFATYAQPAAVPRRTAVPTVVSAFAADIKPAPREWAEQFVKLDMFLEHGAGGHFAAWEQPEAFVSDLRAALVLAEDRQ